MNVKHRVRYFVSLLAVVVLFWGCSSSSELEEYNKSASYWYSKIVDSIAKDDAERADGYYSSLQSEHASSPLLKEATMMLALAHMDAEEYLLAEHFLDEYIKRYASPKERESAEFLKVKSKYLALPYSGRDQAFVADALDAALAFRQTYADSAYGDMVATMIARLSLAVAMFNENIADLYDRLGKERSALYYKSLNEQNSIDVSGALRASPAWYREMFEGDGSSSWYDFMIPTSKSVVSRNSNRDTNTTME